MMVDPDPDLPTSLVGSVVEPVLFRPEQALTSKFFLMESELAAAPAPRMKLVVLHN